MAILHCYYLDEPLNDEEREFVEATLLGPWARFKTGAKSLGQRRVPSVLPMPGAEFSNEKSWEKMFGILSNNLSHAGIGDDRGKQVAFIGPREIRWAALFQNVIYEETGFMPYLLKRWFPVGDDFERQEIQIIDTHGVFFHH